MKRKINKRLVLILILIFPILSIGCADESVENLSISKTDFLMDTVMTVKIFDSRSEELMEDLFDRLREIESKMSITIETSDVNLINENAGIKPVKVDSETYFVLQKAKEYAKISNGDYDPTIGPLTELWDISQTDENRDRLPSEGEIKAAMALIDYEKLELLDDQNVFLQEKGMKINLGSIAKGYAGDQAKKVLAENGVESAIIDLGGNVYAYGDKAGDPWRIGVQDPNESTGVKLGTLNIKDKSIVSSGSYERYFTYNERRYHHILDPKTGYPTDNGLLGVTIISDSSIDGDALSTTLFVLGLEEGKKLVDQMDGLEAIFIEDSDEIHIPKEYEESTFTDIEERFRLVTY